jgi:hypothetical protein
VEDSGKNKKVKNKTVKVDFKEAFFPFMVFQWQYTGKRVILLYILTIFVSLFDVLGLTFVLPLIAVAGSGKENARITDKNLMFFNDIFDFLHINMTLTNIFFTIIVLFVSKGVFKFYVTFFRFGLRKRFFNKLRLEGKLTIEWKLLVDFIRRLYQLCKKISKVNKLILQALCF